MTDSSVRIVLQWSDGRRLEIDHWSGLELETTPTILHDGVEFENTGDLTVNGVPIFQERDDS